MQHWYEGWDPVAAGIVIGISAFAVAASIYEAIRLIRRGKRRRNRE